MGLDHLVATLERWLQLGPLEMMPEPSFFTDKGAKGAPQSAQRAIDAVLKDLYARQAELDALGTDGLDFRAYWDAMNGALASAMDRLMALAASGETATFERIKAALDRLEETGLLTNAAYWRAVKRLERVFQDAR